MRYILTALLFWITGAANAQQPFDIDPSFCTLIEGSVVRNVVEMPDGRLLASGYMKFPVDDMAFRYLARLMPSGSRDLTFPYVPVSGPLKAWQDRWYAGAFQHVRRLDPNGLVDPSFDMGQAEELQWVESGGDFHVLPDGGLLVGNYCFLNDSTAGLSGPYALVWITNTGRLDTTRVHRRGNGGINHIIPLPDGRFICSGYLNEYDGRSVGEVFRIHDDGALDTTFMTPFVSSSVSTLLPLPDGKVLVGGTLRTAGDTLNLVRLMPDGSFDPTFNNELLTIQAEATHYPRNAPVTSVTPWGPDRYIITGSFTHVEGEARGAIAMLDTSGDLMNDHFTSAGCGPTTPPNWGYSIKALHGLLPLNGGNLLIHGAYEGYDDGISTNPGQRFISRLFGPSVGITEYNNSSFAVYPNPGNTLATVELEQLPRNGQLVLRDAMGREVLRQRVAGYHTNVELQGLGAGVYLLEVWEDGGRKAAQRLVVER